MQALADRDDAEHGPAPDLPVVDPAMAVTTHGNEVDTDIEPPPAANPLGAKVMRLYRSCPVAEFALAGGAEFIEERLVDDLHTHSRGGMGISTPTGFHR
jgi:hypothetical protein